MTRVCSIALSAAALAACTAPLPIFDDAGPVGDAGVDAGGNDAGVDAGPMDAGPMDAGPMDAGPMDAGFDGGADAGVDAGPPPSILQITTGSDHTCALLDTGIVYCWGGDSRGALGDGFTTEGFVDDRPDPQPVIDVTNAAAVYAGFEATCAVDGTDGSALCWGNNNPERFGDGVGSGTTPTPEGLFFSGTPEPILELDQTGSHLCVRTATSVFCSGRNSLHQLGRDGAASHLLSEVEGLPFGRTARSVAVGFSSTQGFTLVALDDGTVWCWGANDDSECGQAPSSEVATPTQVPGLARIVRVTAGNDFACALDDRGAVLCWGNNSGGRTGNGVDGGPDVATPTSVAVPPMRELTAEGGSVVAVTEDGASVYGWGVNTSNLLGLGPAMAGAHPTPVMLMLDGASTFEASLSSGHACLLQRRTGMPDVVLCAGGNRNFQLGMDPAPDPTHFNPVPGFP